ncbi:hypothetical protein [Celerinatantimonas sp. YJH-8]|uniref:hypothetical protein n=1 Tax=Celerinatantimonas sp. YJH-8 TaxID=3228714 RepID=UPI0038C553E6
MTSSDSSQQTIEPDQIERFNKRLLTLEKDKMRLWKEQNIQREELLQLHEKWQILRSNTTDDELALATEILETDTPESSNAQIHHSQPQPELPPSPPETTAPMATAPSSQTDDICQEVARLRRQLRLTTWLVVLIAVMLVDWPMLWINLRYWATQFSHLWQ